MPKHLTPCLPTVRHLSLMSESDFSRHTRLWLQALAPQLTWLTLDGQDGFFSAGNLDDEALSALAQCKQLEKAHLSMMDQDTLEVLLGLPSLTKVRCDPDWAADADGQRCGWQCAKRRSIWFAESADALPRGIHTLILTCLPLCTAATPAATFAASQTLAGAVRRACRRLCWARDARIQLVGSVPAPAHVEAALQGLTQLHPFLKNMQVRTSTSSELDEALVRALSTASSYTGHLVLGCASVAPGAWASLVNALPAMRSCSLNVGALSGDSIAALGALCRDPGMAGGSTALRSITVGRVADEAERTLASLAQLQAELQASEAPVKLHTRLFW